MYKGKSSGDKGHPCFTPTVGLTLVALCPSCRRYTYVGTGRQHTGFKDQKGEMQVSIWDGYEPKEPVWGLCCRPFESQCGGVQPGYIHI